MNKPKILIIDDEKNIWDSTARTFRQDDYPVFEAENWKEALEQIGRHKPYILIFDLKDVSPQKHKIYFLH